MNSTEGYIGRLVTVLAAMFPHLMYLHFSCTAGKVPKGKKHDAYPV